MNRDESYLLDVFESSKIILSYLDQKTSEDFLEDIQLQDSIIRRLEIIGEATSRISIKTQNLYPLIPWREMKGMRNLLIHEYDEIDVELVWKTAMEDIPLLVIQLNKILNK
ncbi:MAG: HepT-like ribonuclease domain-containing protein [Ignavibacteriaceae bacterium]